MPAFDEDPAEDLAPATLPFPPLKKSHIMNCSYHSWYPRYRPLTPKARIIPLDQAFVDYLRADGIILPPEPKPPSAPPTDSKWDDSDDDSSQDPSTAWPTIHTQVQKTIATLGGRVAPKLNWSAPKDATWINPTNSQDCRSANDVYLMLKSSDFVTHDLEHAFDGCDQADPDPPLPYHLVLRKFFGLNPSVEFRAFVRRRVLLGVCQRDLNHYDFLPALRPTLLSLIRAFFDRELAASFPDESFAFDVYVPDPYSRVSLLDVNPWAPHTDPLLFSWQELLTMPDPDPADAIVDASDEEEVVRIPIQPVGNEARDDVWTSDDDDNNEQDEDSGDGDGREADDDSDDASALASEQQPLELRLIKKSDPEAYTFNTPQYSAHKLPRDVVDASTAGPGPMQDFATQWRDALERRNNGEDDSDSDA